MANTSDIETDLTLEVEGELTIAKFLKAASAFLNYVDDVTAAVAGDAPRPDWFVQVKKGSNLIGVAPQPGFDPAIISATYARVRRGIEEIDQISELETDIPEAALRDLRRLSEVVGDDTQIRLWVYRSPIAVSQKVAATISEFYGSGYRDFGSVDGKLQAVSERGSHKVEITEALTSKVIRCYLEPALMANALDLFGRRVEAYGRIRYRSDGSILSIQADEFIPFPDPTEIPSLAAVRGILREYA